MIPRRRCVAVAVLVSAGAVLAGCGSASTPAPPVTTWPATMTTAATPSGTTSAAASSAAASPAPEPFPSDLALSRDQAAATARAQGLAQILAAQARKPPRLWARAVDPLMTPAAQAQMRKVGPKGLGWTAVTGPAAPLDQAVPSGPDTVLVLVPTDKGPAVLTMTRTHDGWRSAGMAMFAGVRRG